MSGKDQESELLKNDGECITCQTFLRLAIAEGYTTAECTELAFKRKTFRMYIAHCNGSDNILTALII